MKILFICASDEDYAADPLLHGLRQLYGKDVIDYPKCEPLYTNCSAAIKGQVRGNGFSLYTGLLEDVAIDRHKIRDKIASGYFDLIIFSNIWRTFGYFMEWRSWLTAQNCILLDGEDSAQVYPHAGFWWRRPYYWFLPRADSGFLYFKREWTENSQFNLWHRLLPQAMRRLLPSYRGLRRFSFSFPAEKIVDSIPVKTALFGRHIVDPEVATRIPGSSTKYVFSSESEYYGNLQSARFGITTKRAGWDCLRHYEIAANGCVPCFRDLDRKPINCAPHGLIPGVNCIQYHSADDLMSSVDRISESEYRRLVSGALDWARACSTVARAGQLIGFWRVWCVQNGGSSLRASNEIQELNA